jgi:hypothetical protein
MLLSFFLIDDSSEEFLHVLIIIFFHRIFEEIQKIEDNEFHYQEQVLEFKFFSNVYCDQVETGVDIVPLFGRVTGVLILPLSVM